MAASQDPTSATKNALVCYREAAELYGGGKHRRYELLFAVNGGAFAIAKLLGEKVNGLGGLNLQMIACGMILFTCVMVFDIFVFGLKSHLIAKEIDSRRHYQIFEWQGRVVLIAIGLLICAAWSLAGWNPNDMKLAPSHAAERRTSSQ